MTRVHNGARFSARDRDQDRSSLSCSQRFQGGWWYNSCHEANPNGRYYNGNHTSFADGVNWKSFRGYQHSLRFFEMKLRKK